MLRKSIVSLTVACALSGIAESRPPVIDIDLIEPIPTKPATTNVEYGAGLILKKKKRLVPIIDTPLEPIKPNDELQLQDASRTIISQNNYDTEAYLGALLNEKVTHQTFDSNGAQVVTFNGQKTVAELKIMAASLMATGEYAYVDINHYVKHQLTPNDPQLSNMWGLINQTAGIRAPAAWDDNQGQNVTVAVIDTGYRPHADLAANIVGGYDFISNPTTARDGNGRDSNAMDEGDWTTLGECGTDQNGNPLPAQNSSWHGTHVAGTVAAVGNNNNGVVGVAYKSKVVPIRVLGRCGGTTSDTADAIRWAAGGNVPGVPTNPNPAKVINLSLGGFGNCQTSTQNAINYARSQGAVVVIAAGNNSLDVSNFQPANCNGIISVASLTSTGNRSDFSNFGNRIDVIAPGSLILSTLNSGTTTPGTDSYQYYNGTSMATPHVAGVAALMLTRNSALTPDQVENRIKSSARNFTSGSNCNTAVCGDGILDAPAAIDAAGINYVDVYPGDTAYNALVQEIYHEVSSDNIDLNFNSSIQTRTQLCNLLVSRHNGGTNPGQSQTNSAYIGESITVNQCLNALWFSDGYDSNADWNQWTGNHVGTWYDQTNSFTDNANWLQSVNEAANDPNDTDANGNTRVYNFQQVEFLGANAHFGWNQAHHEVAYVWGWDPKDQTNTDGTVGTHVGWTFDLGTAKCIIWVTKNEAFLECVKDVGSETRRTSTGFFGFGQWTVES